MPSPDKHVPRLLIKESDLIPKNSSAHKTEIGAFYELKLNLNRYHHLKNVLRLSPNQALDIQIWEQGNWARFSLLEWGKDCLRLQALDSSDSDFFPTAEKALDAASMPAPINWQKPPQKLKAQTERMAQIELSLGLLKNHDTLSWVIEKVVELGCQKINLLQCEFSQIGLKIFASNSNKMAKLEQLVENTLEQSQQFARVELKLFSFADYCQQLKEKKETLLVGSLPDQEIISPNADLKTAAKKSQKIHLLIGPEGGLSPHELKICQELEAIGLNLGASILRAETAALIGFYEIKKILNDSNI